MGLDMYMYAKRQMPNDKNGRIVFIETQVANWRNKWELHDNIQFNSDYCDGFYQCGCDYYLSRKNLLDIIECAEDAGDFETSEKIESILEEFDESYYFAYCYSC